MKKILLILSILTTVATPAVATDTSDCKDEENGIKSGTLMNNECIPSACIENRWQLTGEGNDKKCVEQECEFDNGTGEWEKNNNGILECKLKNCAHGYKPNDNGTKCVAGQLSESDSQAKADELRDNAQAMRDKEQSTANKLLGAAGIGATGIGGMQMASAMAEQSADEDAETAMRAYLATFHCDYGGGQNIPGGKTNVELPGGNELIDLYSEYVNLANDLKVRKTALDMRPGIESESILDAATSGLYDDVAIGKTSGAYTSLARALMDPNGADAAAWAQQKAETANKKKTGMITAGIGAAGSLVGNLAINSGKDKQNKLNEILNKYDKKKQLLDDLQSDVAAIPPQTAPCPAGTTGTAHPDCTCTDPTKIYNPKTLKCEECTGGQTVQNGKCKCPTDKPYRNDTTNECTERLTTNPTLNTPNLPTQADLALVQTSPTPQSQTAVLSAGSLFKINSPVLRREAKTALKTFIDGLSTAGYTHCTITVNGYTDPVGNETNNKTLSQDRAEAVKQYIKDLDNTENLEVIAKGHGEIDCTCGAGKSSTDTDGKLNGQPINYNNREYSECRGKPNNFTLSDNARYAPCRRVEISAECTKSQ